MATVKPGSKKQQNTQTKSREVRFLNYDLDKSTKEQFKRWAHENAAEFSNFVDRLIDDGFNLSVKRDDFNDCVAAYITPQSSEHPLYGILLTGRGSTAFGAIMGALYRHYVVFEGSWDVENIRRAGLDDE